MSGRRPPSHGLAGTMQQAAADRGIMFDECQLAVAGRLQRLFDQLVAFKRARRNRLRKLLVHPPIPKGVYLWGGVGRGKSLLMNFFFEALPYRRKRRVHFHAFMQEVHEEIKTLKLEADPLARVAARIARETRFLCFDEFHVSDIADAMILGRLLDQMFDRGVVMMMTSNYPPDGLYPNGLQRINFLPTIELLKRKLEVFEVDAGVDYRLRVLEQMEVWHVPADTPGEERLAENFRALASGKGNDRPIEILGRQLPVRRRATGVIWFDFATLCGGPRSQNDYLDLARHFHTVLLSAIPRMGANQASEARRFTWLIDVLYEHRVKLVATAEAEAHRLYLEGPNANEFQRTASRLIEMRSHDYLASGHLVEDTAEKRSAA